MTGIPQGATGAGSGLVPAGATRISSRYTAFFKRVFPVIWFGILAAVVAVAAMDPAARAAPAFLAIPLAMAVFGYFLFRRLLWDLADEVYDCGDWLLVRNGGQEERIPLANIMNVSVTTLVNPPRATLKLAMPGMSGDELVFSPAQRFTFNPLARNEVIDRLIVRIDQARGRPAR